MKLLTGAVIMIKGNHVGGAFTKVGPVAFHFDLINEKLLAMFVDAATGHSVDAGERILVAFFSSWAMMFEATKVDFFTFTETFRCSLGNGMGEPFDRVITTEVSFDQKMMAAFSQDFEGVGTVIACIHAHQDRMFWFEFA